VGLGAQQASHLDMGWDADPLNCTAFAVMNYSPHAIAIPRISKHPSC
jgi:hypothetical protein